jgi:hypothetical protein
MGQTRSKERDLYVRMLKTKGFNLNSSMSKSAHEINVIVLCLIV